MKKNGSMLFAKRLKAERKKMKLTQKQFASILEVSQATVSHYENGLQFPEKDALVKICKIFDISPDELLFNRTTDSKSEEKRTENEQEKRSNHKLFLEDVLKEQKNNEQLQRDYTIYVDGQPVTPEELDTMINYLRFNRSNLTQHS